MRWASQLALKLGGGRQIRPATLKEKSAQIQQPTQHVQPPREHVDPELLINGFLYSCPAREVVDPRDLSSLKILFDAFAEAENAIGLGQWDLARALARRGIAHDQREMQSYEVGYELAVLESGSPRPRVTFFVMPPSFPIKARDNGGTEPRERKASGVQTDLFSGEEKNSMTQKPTWPATGASRSDDELSTSRCRHAERRANVASGVKQ